MVGAALLLGLLRSNLVEGQNYQAWAAGQNAANAVVWTAAEHGEMP